MVSILSVGDMTYDEGPLIRKTKNRHESLHHPVQGFIQHSENTNQPHRGQVNEGRSLFTDLNQRLINMGFPRWNIGNQVIEPIMSVVLLLMIMLMGMRGILLVGVLYLFSQFSRR
uniref:Family with sequence similarity 241 member B n=1 Tax=Callorhinchus milii TaxID=7868 RepID=A0A4W3HCR1_CALMI